MADDDANDSTEPSNLAEQIADMRDWWHPHNQDTFVQLARELVGHGFDQDEALRILGAAAGAIADEYGD